MTAVVVDPFGNLLGIMYNQHYLDTLASVTGNGAGAVAAG